MCRSSSVSAGRRALVWLPSLPTASSCRRRDLACRKGLRASHLRHRPRRGRRPRLTAGCGCRRPCGGGHPPRHVRTRRRFLASPAALSGRRKSTRAGEERHLAVHDLHLIGLTGRDAKVVNGDLLERGGAHRAPVARRLAALEATGVTEIAYQPAGPVSRASWTLRGGRGALSGRGHIAPHRAGLQSRSFACQAARADAYSRRRSRDGHVRLPD